MNRFLLNAYLTKNLIVYNLPNLYKLIYVYAFFYVFLETN